MSLWHEHRVAQSREKNFPLLPDLGRAGTRPPDRLMKTGQERARELLIIRILFRLFWFVLANQNST